MPARRGTALGRVVMSVVTPGRFRDGGRMRKPLTKTETLHVVKDPRDVAPQNPAMRTHKAKDPDLLRFWLTGEVSGKREVMPPIVSEERWRAIGAALMGGATVAAVSERFRVKNR